ncbi:response regulator [Candidatus Woesearchaeota archaeon]|nr:MAG: response regulator receiver protein [archaeon GW2011_AR4]MBS3130643.1 response regulator [Candidatus Woesearchaeota archaeon]HIH37962.1 response regulator [Candidatus Woesearchaeota archaeon]HIH48656.1 response regulator [Candidatus Woesearchaeota archaeon]
MAHMTKLDILIIEDDENIAKAQALILQDDYNVHIASDGEEGLMKAKKLKPGVVLLDLMLPKRSGYDVCFHLRQDKQLAGTKVVMVTAKNQPIDKDKGLFIGADLYLTKPFLPEDLLGAIDTVLKK